MKVFTSQLLYLEPDEYRASFHIDFMFAFLMLLISCFFGYFFLDQLIYGFHTLFVQNVSFTSLNKDMKFAIGVILPVLVLCLFIMLQCLYIGFVKVFSQKTHPIYQFIKNKNIANKIYSDAAQLFKSYHKSHKVTNVEIILKQLNNSDLSLLEQLDEQIYNVLQQYSNENNINLSDFPIYQELFMKFVAPIQIKTLNNMLTKIEKDFPYAENNLSPQQFLDMVKKLKIIMTFNFKHDDYHAYKMWYNFAHDEIFSVIDKKCINY